MTNLHNLYNTFHVSPWLDNLSRDLIQSGSLQTYVDQGVRGVTSNPSIFEHAFGSTDTYDQALADLRSQGNGTEESYWQLAVEDIQAACDVLRAAYDASNKEDGYVSLEVSPNFAQDCDATVLQAQELWTRVNRPNLMIKIPATEACIPAITICIAQGMNINVTLIFSLSRYLKVINAYMAGLEKCVEPSSVHSVASFFISRVDSEVDARLIELGREDLKGTAAVAQALAAYGIFLESFNPLAERWARLAARGALIQRPLWASTSTKDPSYPDLKYVEGLLTPDSVNTLPDATIAGIIDHAQLDNLSAIDASDIQSAHDQLTMLASCGIDMNAVAEKIEYEGVEKFQKAFETMLSALATK